MLMSFFQRLSFRFTLFLVILVIGLTPLSFSVLFNLPKILVKFNELAEVEQVNKIIQHVHSVELLLHRYEENMRIIVRLPSIRSLVSAGNDPHIQPVLIRKRLNGFLGNNFTEKSMEELVIINSSDQLVFSWRNPLSVASGAEIDQLSQADMISSWSNEARKQKPGEVFITSLRSETLLVDKKHEHSPKVLMVIPLQDRQGKFGGVAVGKFFLFNQGADPIPYDLMINGAGTVFYDRRDDIHDHVETHGHQHQQKTLMSVYPDLAKATPETEYMFGAGNQGGKMLFYQVLPNQRKEYSLWVANTVDTSILDQWVSFFLIRFVILISLLIGGAMLVARFVAGKADRARNQLITGVTGLVHDDKPIDLGWKWPLELSELNNELYSLSTTLLASEESLQSQTRFVRGVFDGIQDGVAVINKDLIITDTNATLKKWRSDLRPLRTKTCYEVIRLRDTPCEVSLCPTKRAMAEKTLQRDEFSAVEPDGCEKWYEVTAYPIFEENGEVGSVVEFLRDITEIKQAEKEKQSLEQQLAFAQKMESIGTLAGGVAHDFNNMLSAINGYAELTLMKMDADDPHREAMNAILESGQRAARLTQQLLAFSRKQIIQPEQINLNDEIADTQEMLKRLLGEHIDVVVHAGRSLWPVKADRTQIDQVLVNLAVNARDAMREGGTLTIETANQRLDEEYIQTHHELPSGDYVLLTVSDTGHGMSKETLAHVFEPFFTTKIKGKGTGLGLATSYGIIRQHGGSVHVYSEPGQGTVFKVYLPRMLDEEEGQSGKAVTKAEISSGGNETILLVEDDPMVRRICVDIMKNFGYSILEAENGEDALQVFERYHGKIDLLLTDVVMPRMGGTELAEKIREMDPDIRVIFMSGYTENAIVHKGILDEGIDFIHKPITPDSLAFGIRKVFDHS